MPIAISSFITPTSASVPFLLMDSDLRGSMRVVADETARLAIPTGARVEGMLVWQNDTQTMYQLVGGTTDTHCPDPNGNPVGPSPARW